MALDISLRTLRWEAIAHRERPEGLSVTLGLQGFQATSQFDDDGTVELLYAPLIPNATATEASAFAVLDRAMDRGGVQLSARTDRRVTTEETARVDGLFSAAGGMHWDLSESTVLRLGVAHSERAPGMAELYSQGIHYSAFRIELGEVDLKKERSFNVESSMEWTPAWGRFEVSLYQNAIDDFVFLRPNGVALDGWAVHTWEATDALFQGTEASLQVAPEQWKHVQVASVFSFVDARNRNGEVLPFIPPATLRSTVGWANGDAGRLSGLFANAVWNHNRDASLLHLAAGGKISESIAVNLSVQNLLNAEFIPSMSLLRTLGIPEPGRNVRVQLAWTF